MNKFEVGEKVSVKLYGTPMIGTVKSFNKDGYYVETSKKDISRRQVPIILFLKESKIDKIVVPVED
jgi:hypothetical protein